jgi:methionyl-tRNA formyltransferase
MDLYRVIYAGTPDFAVPSLEALYHDPRFEVVAVLTQPDRPAGRGQKLQASPVKNFALAHQLPVLQPLTLKDEVIQQTLRLLRADVMIVAAYGLILPPAVLNIPAQGCINIHGSILPRWRGAAPVQRAIEVGDQLTGISIMQMEQGLDTGPVFYCNTCLIDEKDTALSLMKKLSYQGAEALMTCLPNILTHQLQAQPQNNSEASYAKKLDKAEGLIDWREDARVLQQRIRAFYPWPGCYFDWHGARVKIGEAEVILLDQPETPGCLLKQDADGIIIACQKNALRLLQIQLPGGKMGAMQRLPDSLQALPK